MHRLSRFTLVIANFALLLATASVSAQETHRPESDGVSDIERQALIALYKATDGDHWTNHDGWLGPAGTECRWQGVECWSHLNPRPQQVTGIDLMENHLVGTIPDTVGQLSHLSDLNLMGNQISGMLPQPLIEQWLAGTLRVVGDANLLTDISKIEYEMDPSALLCGYKRLIFDASGHTTRYEIRCRNATPDDRRTYCEVKQGKLYEFAMLAWVLEKNGFFQLKPKYSGNVTDSAFITVRATKNEKLSSVEVYAWGAPIEFSIIQLALEGAGSSAVDWQKTTKQAKCPPSIAGSSFE